MHEKTPGASAARHATGVLLCLELLCAGIPAAFRTNVLVPLPYRKPHSTETIATNRIAEEQCLRSEISEEHVAQVEELVREFPTPGFFGLVLAPLDARRHSDPTFNHPVRELETDLRYCDGSLDQLVHDLAHWLKRLSELPGVEATAATPAAAPAPTPSDQAPTGRGRIADALSGKPRSIHTGQQNGPGQGPRH